LHEPLYLLRAGTMSEIIEFPSLLVSDEGLRVRQAGSMHSFELFIIQHDTEGCRDFLSDISLHIE
jgi:hypothetical protein